MSINKQKKTRVGHNSPMMVRIGEFLGRKKETLWTIHEAGTLLGLLPAESEVEAMERYYLADIPDDPVTRKRRDFRRHDLPTLLNNWTGELDKARLWELETKRS